MNVNSSRVLVLIGSVLLGAGAFTPVLWVPVRGTTNLLAVDQAGVAALVLAGAALLLALVEQTRHAIWPGILALLLLGYAYIQVQKQIAQAQQRLGDSDNPLDIIRDAVAASARLEYGWAVLVLGALLILAGGIMAWRAARVRDAG